MQRRIILGTLFALGLQIVQSIRYRSELDQDIGHGQPNLHQVVLHGDNGARIEPMDAAGPHKGKEIPQSRRSQWIVHCDSEEPGKECSNAVHGSSKTSSWQSKSSLPGPDPLPHSITIDLRYIENVNGIRMTPRRDAEAGGGITAHKIYLSLDNKTWGEPVAFGTWFHDRQGQAIPFG